MGCSSPEIETPSSGLFNYDKEKEKVDFKELFMESLSPEFLKLFQENINLFYSRSFYEGIGYEYGLFGKSKNPSKAYKIYKDAADFKYDYLCMYRMHRIFIKDYEDFGVKKNADLHRLYLYKCLAYLPYLILDWTYLLLKTINVKFEVSWMTEDFDNGNFKKFDEFMKFLDINKKHFNITGNDIKLMKCVFQGLFRSDLIEKDITIINELLQFEKGDNAYYEAQLKYCNFYFKYSKEGLDREKINNIFDNLIKEGYYKACCDYGGFLIDQKRYDDAKVIFKKGLDNSQQFCFCEYTYLCLRETNFNQILKDFELASHILKSLCLIICFDKLRQSSFYYMLYYLAKHSSFKKNILNDFSKYALELFKSTEKLLGNVDVESLGKIFDIFGEKYVIENLGLFGILCYYDIPDIIKSDKERALIYFKYAYQFAKKNDEDFLKRINYLYIYKCRKFLFKNNKITLRKLNKTKEKLLRLYEESYVLENSVEVYNYYKLYKVYVCGNDKQDRLISILEDGIKENSNYDCKNYVYMEKCKLALDKEYSSNSSLNQNKVILENEGSTKDDINLIFETQYREQYNLRVPKNIPFINAINMLYTKYPDLESEKIGKYESIWHKINIFDTIKDNGLVNNIIIFIKD